MTWCAAYSTTGVCWKCITIRKAGHSATRNIKRSLVLTEGFGLHRCFLVVNFTLDTRNKTRLVWHLDNLLDFYWESRGNLCCNDDYKRVSVLHIEPAYCMYCPAEWRCWQQQCCVCLFPSSFPCLLVLSNEINYWQVSEALCITPEFLELQWSPKSPLNLWRAWDWFEHCTVKTTWWNASVILNERWFYLPGPRGLSSGPHQSSLRASYVLIQNAQQLLKKALLAAAPKPLTSASNEDKAILAYGAHDLRVPFQVMHHPKWKYIDRTSSSPGLNPRTPWPSALWR